MIHLKTTWNYTKQTEVERLLGITSDTYKRFFLLNNFLVLPYLLSKDTQSVYLPKLGILFSKKEKLLIANLKTEDSPPLTIPVQLFDKVSSQYIFEPKLSEVNNLKNDWEDIEKRFWTTVEILFPQIYGSNISVEIRPTSFGTCSSFNLVRMTKNIHIIIYIRLDMPISNIAEAILSSLLRPELFDMCFDWGQTEAVVDFLLTKTLFKKIFPRYSPTITSISDKQKGKLLKESLDYQASIGVETGHLFEIKEGKTYVQNKPFTKFTQTEQKVFSLLIKKKNYPCNFDEISQVIWGEYCIDKYSPWAIAKTIQRIRFKMSELGISPNVIRAYRKEGYLLVD
jgi:hypothetical protein